MPDIMSVSLQDVLYCRKSDLREQKVIASQQQKNNGEGSGLISRCLMHVRREPKRAGEEHAFG